MKKVLVIGGDGQLGRSIKFISNKFKDIDFFLTNKSTLDITNKEQLNKFFKDYSFDFVVNCAAYTQVDLSEKYREEAFRVNAIAVEYLSKLSSDYGAKIIHISTDYVFDGEKKLAYTEQDIPNPINVYGESKLEGERILIDNNKRAFIIRTSWLYSPFGDNFVLKMIKLFKEKKQVEVVENQIGSPTFSIDLSKAICILIRDNSTKYGIYNFSNLGQCSWYEFALEIKKHLKSQIEIIPIKSQQYITEVNRPKYSLLDKRKIREVFNMNIPHWQDSLRIFLDDFYSIK